MFQSKSRYAKIATSTYTTVDGREIGYVRRRFLPQPDRGQTVLEHRTSGGERLDNVTAKYICDPEAFWRVCDANLVIHPVELTDEIGRSVRIALPEF